MNKSVKVNFALQPETAAMMEKLCAATFRTKSDMIDYLVAQEYARLYSQPNPCVTVGEAEEAAEH